MQEALVIRGEGCTTSSLAVQRALGPGIRIEDVYTRSAHGEVENVYTPLPGLRDFAILQPSAYTRHWFAANVS